MKGLVVTATAHDGRPHRLCGGHGDRNVFVTTVIDGPSITASNSSGTEAILSLSTIAGASRRDTTDRFGNPVESPISGVPRMRH